MAPTRQLPAGDTAWPGPARNTPKSPNLLIIRILMAAATPGPSSCPCRQHARVEPVSRRTDEKSAKPSRTSSLPHDVAERRPPALRRCWLFLPGADRGALISASACGADVLIQELEDFTPPDLRGQARALAVEIFPTWRAAGRLAAVRINPLESEGRADLVAVMQARPDIVAMSKVAEPDQVARLNEEVT